MKVSQWICFVMSCSVAFANACETKRTVYIDNKETKVWKTTLCPNEKLPYHTHQYARVLIPNENGTLKVIYQSGKEYFIQLKKQKPLLLDAAQGNKPHQDINVGKHPLNMMVIELRH